PDRRAYTSRGPSPEVGAMTKRRLVWVAVAGCLARATAAAAGRGTRRACPINRANFERLRHGRTRAEVAALRGGPPGFYGRGVFQLDGGEHDPADPRRWESWVGERWAVNVRFDEGGRVSGATLRSGACVPPPSPVPPPSLLDRLGDGLGL